MDDVISEQLKSGIIEQINDPDSYIKDPEVKFIAHMPIFKLNRETTKCRIVYLANISERGNCINHNQALLAGPNLNKKITTTLINMRFDKHILIFDLVKAFLNLELFFS